MSRPRTPRDPLAPLARRVLGRVLLVAALLGASSAAVAAALAGPGGAAGAVAGTALGTILVAGGVPGLRRPRGGSPLGPVVVALGLRLGLYAAALALVSRAAWIHGPSLALTTAASVACLLAVGLHAVSRGSATVLELDETTTTGS